MSPAVIIAAIVAIPVILLMVLRINAVLVFLSLCLGDVLVQFTASGAQSYVVNIAANNPHASYASNSNIDLALLLLPAVLTALIMVHSIRKGTRLLLNALPAIGVGLLAALLIVPLMSAGLRHNVVDSSLWQQIQRVEDLIVGASATVCLLVLWMQRHKSGGEGKHGHGKHHKE